MYYKTIYQYNAGWYLLSVKYPAVELQHQITVTRLIILFKKEAPNTLRYVLVSHIFNKWAKGLFTKVKTA